VGGDRAEQLGWTRRELREILVRHTPELACLRVAEAAQNAASSLSRAEMDGVVQATLAEIGIPVRRFLAVSVRAAFRAKRSVDLEAAIETIPCVAATAKSRRDQLVVAVAGLPA